MAGEDSLWNALLAGVYDFSFYPRLT